MKNLQIPLLGLAIVFLLSSCGVNNALVLNQNQNATQVHLANDNFKTVAKVSGSAEVEYVLLFGGMNRTRLYENAYANMVKEAELMTGSRALVNIVTEEHIGGVPPFYYKRTLTVSAHVIEFTR